MIDKPDRTRGQATEDAANALRNALRSGDDISVAAVEKTRMPMVVTDCTAPGNPIIYANGAFLDFSGYEMDEVLGQNYHFLSGSRTDPEVGEKIDRILETQDDAIEEVLYYKKNGTPMWVSQFITPIRDNGKVTHHFSSLIDITDRVMTERRLRELNTTLEQRVTARTRSLEQAQERMESEIERRRHLEAVLRDTLAQEQEHGREKDLLIHEKDFLIKEINHRTKNAIGMAAALLRLQSRRASDETKAALLSAVQRLTRIAEVHEMLYSTDAPETIHFTDYVKRLSSSLVNSLQGPSQRIDLQIEADEARWGPDLVTRLALIVTEAITNSMKYAFSETDEGWIRIFLRHVGGGLVCLEVEDNGVGIATDEHPDEGLGLRLIDVLAKQIGGSASVSARPNRGTVVAVSFRDPDAPGPA